MKNLFSRTGFTFYILMIFINAFVDLGHKIVVQNTIFKVYDGSTQIILTAIVNALILIPFVLLFSPSGYLADRFRKPIVMQISAAVAVILTLLITLSYYAGWFEVAFAMTFLLAVQSAFYSPAKYGYIREIGGKDNLAMANGVVQATTIVAILSGVFIFSILFEYFLAGQHYQNKSELIQWIAPIGWLLVLASIVELFAAFKLPSYDSDEPQSKPAFDFNQYTHATYLKKNLKTITQNATIWLSIVGLSVFWAVSQVVLATFPAYAKEVLNENNTIIVQGLLACSGIGIVIGSLISGRISRNYIETGVIPIGALGMVISLALLPMLPSVYMLAIDILVFGIFGGLFIVPLNALIQFHAPKGQLGTVIAGNNWIQNVVMLGFLILTVIVSYLGFSSQWILFGIVIVVAIGTAYTVYQLPQSLVRFVIGAVFSSQYSLQVRGFHHIPSTGGVLMLGNHISWLDWAILQMASPRSIRFVMHKRIYERWYIRWFLDIFGTIPIAPGHSKKALEDIRQLLNNGEVVCLFPEGAISRSGQLGEFRDGFERAAKDADAIIIPFYLRGLWGSRFSRASEWTKRQSFALARRKIIISFGEPLSIESNTSAVKSAVFDLSIDSWQAYTQTMGSLASEWIETVKYAPRAMALKDAVGGKALSRAEVFAGAVSLSRKMARRSASQNAGLLLPTSSGGIMANMAALLLGRTVVNLNFTAPEASLIDAVKQANIDCIFTSRRFISKLERKGIDLSALFELCPLVYLEDLAKDISSSEKLLTWLSVYLLPASVLRLLYCKDTDNAAAILFSSGSEGTPKGVVLSHSNMVANIRQVSEVLDIVDDDTMMATLPLFHAFGLTVNSLLPLLSGIPAIAHPDPTDVLNIGKAIASERGTILCGTSTFFRLYVRNRRVNALMLDSLRLVVSGAERLKPEIRDDFETKFNKRIYEGYGTTETTPVASVNIPDRLALDDFKIQQGNKPGTVGLPLPGTSFRIVDPDTMEPVETGEDGLILIGGVQVMDGYLNAPEKTAEVITTFDGIRWYKTGDKGHLDENGFLIIVDRYSRFAKIGGEMVSLSSVELALSPCLTAEEDIVAVAIPDDKKGEAVVILYSGTDTEDGMNARFKQVKTINPLMQPSRVICVEQLPKLGSGKTDFKLAKHLAIQAID